MAEFDLFAFLAEASPWWWVALAIAIGAMEMVTFTYFLIWLALAAFGTGLGLWLFPGMSGVAQLTLFAVLAIAFTVAGRYWLAHRRATPSDAPGLNRRSERVIGRTGKALDDFDGSEGAVLIDGVRWRARLTAGQAKKNQKVSVIDADGMTLICEAV